MVIPGLSSSIRPTAVVCLVEEILEGHGETRAILEWAELHKAELLENWQLGC